MSHTPSLERIQSAMEPLFPIELRFTELASQPGGVLHISQGALYNLFVISRRFEGMPRVERHRIVYEYLKPFIGHGVHSINMTLLAPSESRH
ncbi:MAG: BolA/IbaG family iron-sulfur metabolism protein [Burkholderiaceae bacterium]|nr:BolA/IbaG family iron-sulfur metabolism protein [Burkholderiaceae bacterium]